MLGMLLNSVDGRFGVYPQPVYTPNRCIHRLGVYTQPVYTPKGVYPNRPSTLLSRMPNIAPHPKPFWKRMCLMCLEGWLGASTGHIHRLGVYTGSGVYTQPVYMVSQGTTPTFQTHSLLKKFGCGALLGMLLNSVGLLVRGTSHVKCKCVSLCRVQDLKFYSNCKS